MVGILILSGCSGNPRAGLSPSVKPSQEPLPEIVFALHEDRPSPDLREVEQEINRMVVPRLGAAVRLTPIPREHYYNQIQLMMLRQEPLDLFVTMDSKENHTMITKGQLLDMNDLLEQYGPDIKSLIEPDLLNSLKVNGGLYNIPNIRDWAANYGIIMRKDLLERHQLDPADIHKLDDLEQVFQVIKEKETGIYPIVPMFTPSIYSTMSGAKYDSLGNSLGVLQDYTSSLDIVNLYETAEYEEDIRLIHRWYNAGYIPKDAAISTNSSRELIRAGKAFAFFSPLKPGIEEQESRLIGMPMAAIPLSEPIMTTDSIMKFGMGIPADSRYPDLAMKFLNMLYSDANLLNTLFYGLEGKHYIKASEHTITYPPGKDAGNVSYSFDNYEVGNQFIAYTWQSDDPQAWDKMDLFNKQAVRSQALGFTFNMDSVRTELSVVQGVIDQYLNGLESGTLDPAEALPEFRSALREAGIDKIIEEKQRQLKQWAANPSR